MNEVVVRLYIDPVLHTPCLPIEKIDDDLVELVGKMFMIMIQNKGVGLAAPQIGINKQLAVVSLENNQRTLTLINPKIIKASSKKVKAIEGCLSAPKVFVPVKRPESLLVEFINLKGETALYEFTGYDARIVAHEISHLQGKMITDFLTEHK